MTVIAHKSIMIALLNNISVLNDQNIICVLYGRKPVGNNKSGLTLHKITHSALYELFGTGVDVGGRLVEN